MENSDIRIEIHIVAYRNYVLAQPLPYHTGIRKQFLGGGKKK
jgi:hypothetical protein